jgi:undecaprenyl-diphosphatase
MTIWEALILGLIQGATEFLPVSSSGHLVIGQALLGIRIPGVSFEVAVHVATLFSVLLVFRKRLLQLLMGVIRGDKEAWRYVGLLFVATLPAVAVGLGARAAVEELFEKPMVAGFGLLVTGSFLWTARGAMARIPPHDSGHATGKPGLKEALLMGIAQAFAIVPGISRSGATVVTGLWLGVEAEEAAAFSFLMAIPAILGAAVLQIPELQETGTVGGPALLAGSLIAAVAGVLAIWTFVELLKRKAFHRFGPYCWGLGGVFLLYLFLIA